MSILIKSFLLCHLQKRWKRLRTERLLKTEKPKQTFLIKRMDINHMYWLLRTVLRIVPHFFEIPQQMLQYLRYGNTANRNCVVLIGKLRCNASSIPSKLPNDFPREYGDTFIEFSQLESSGIEWKTRNRNLQKSH